MSKSPQKNEWNSTKQSLPETDVCVLAVVNGTYGNITFVDAIRIAEYLGDGWYIESYPNIENPQVDYWMPLPEPPKQL